MCLHCIQRVALIRTLALKPDILLLDEAFSKLDSQTKLFVLDDVNKILRNEKKSAIMVTHDIDEAVCFSNKIIILSNIPTIIKKEIIIEFDDNLTPKEKKYSNKYNYYIKQIYEEVDSNV